MTKIQIKGARAELVKELRAREIDPEEWYEDTCKINEALDYMGLKVNADTLTNFGSGEAETLINYYSVKIGHTIILQWDGFKACDTLEELADYLVEFEEEAAKLEAKLPKVRN